MVGQRLFGFGIPDVVPDLLGAHLFVQVAAGQQQRFAQFIIAETAASALCGVLALAIAMDDPLDTLGGDGVGIIAHFHQNKFAVSAIRFVHIQHRMGCGAGPCEGIQNQSVLCSGNFQHKLDQAVRFRRIECSLAVKNRKHFFFGFIGMSRFRERPEVRWYTSTNIIKISLSPNTTFTALAKVERWPAPTIINFRGFLKGLLQCGCQHNCFNISLNLFYIHTTY